MKKRSFSYALHWLLFEKKKIMLWLLFISTVPLDWWNIEFPRTKQREQANMKVWVRAPTKIISY